MKLHAFRLSGERTEKEADDTLDSQASLLSFNQVLNCAMEVLGQTENCLHRGSVDFPLALFEQLDLPDGNPRSACQFGLGQTTVLPHGSQPGIGIPILKIGSHPIHELHDVHLVVQGIKFHDACQGYSRKDFHE